MEGEDLNVNNCDTKLDGKLKLVAIHLGLSDNGGTGERQKELAKKICEKIMLSREEDTPKRPEQRSPFCSNMQCKSQPGRPSDELSSHHAEDAVVRLIRFMEEENTLNCGYGSNLTMSGQVECDASLMSSRTCTWTGVGAVSGCRQPIELAKSLHDHQWTARPLGLVQPNLLVGSGTKKWMRDHCPHLIIPDSRLISANSLARYQKFKSAYDAAVRSRTRDGPTDPALGDQMDTSMDTVGAIAVDCDDNFACAISSGGIILKHKGRIGQACVPGAGCWAQSSTAVTTTGTGELLSSTLMAKMFHELLAGQRLLRSVGLLKDICLLKAIGDCFVQLAKSSHSSHATSLGRLAGILAVSAIEPDESGLPIDDGASSPCKREPEFHLTVGHNGRSMCVGYMTRNDLSGQSLLLNRSGEDVGSPLCESFRLNV